jgi:hypothetical protein
MGVVKVERRKPGGKKTALSPLVSTFDTEATVAVTP